MNMSQLLTIGSDVFVILFIGQMWRMFTNIIAKVQKVEDKIYVLENTINAITEVKIKKN